VDNASQTLYVVGNGDVLACRISDGALAFNSGTEAIRVSLFFPRKGN
jgi:hypothetical protein